MMLGLLPKMLVILALFLALFDPSPISGLKCYTCGEMSWDHQSDVSGNWTGNVTTPPPSIGPMSILSISKLNLQSRGASARATSVACNEGSDVKPTGDQIHCESTVNATLAWACWKTKKKNSINKMCIVVGQPQEMGCVQEGSDFVCLCDDKDLCNGGSPLRNGFGMMSLALGAVYYVFC